MKWVFKWLDPLSLLGQKIELEHLFQKPLNKDETLRLDRGGSFYLIKVPENRAAVWNKLIFWGNLHFNKRDHLKAIVRALSLFEERIFKQSIFKEDYQKIIQQIECLKSLKNDYGFTLNDEYLEELDLKLEGIQHQVYSLLEKNEQLIAEENEKLQQEAFYLFLHDAKATLALLKQETQFGLQEARRMVGAFTDDIPLLFESRLRNIHSRLLLIQELFTEIEAVERIYCNQFMIASNQAQLNNIWDRLNREVNLLEDELEILINNLKLYCFYYPQDVSVYEYLILMGINPSCDEKFFSFDIEKPIKEKINLIQDHLRQLAA